MDCLGVSFWADLRSFEEGLRRVAFLVALLTVENGFLARLLGSLADDRNGFLARLLGSLADGRSGFFAGLLSRSFLARSLSCGL